MGMRSNTKFIDMDKQNIPIDKLLRDLDRLRHDIEQWASEEIGATHVACFGNREFIPIWKQFKFERLTQEGRSRNKRNPGIDLYATYMVFFDFSGEEMDLVELVNPMDYFDYVQDDQTGVYSVERWINGEYLVDYVRELAKTDCVGDVISIVNQETNKEYDGWPEVRRLIKR